jgi:photosystem II stability/assembly factor-like uncharacterized protein
MRYLNLLLTIGSFLSVAIVTGCSPGSGSFPPRLSLKGSWESAGLKSVSINSFNQFKGSLYAATDSGIYKISLKTRNNPWKSLGLQNKKVLDLVFLPDNKLLSVVRIADCCKGIPSLYLSDDQEKSWQPYMNNFGGPTGKYTWIESMASISKPSDTLFTQASGGIVARSINAGRTWHMVHLEWNKLGGFGEFVFVDPYTKGIVWAGGSNAIFQPVLLKSNNYGKDWERIKGVGGIVEDLIVKHNDSDHVLAGLLGGISKSVDGGKIWHSALNKFAIYTITCSARDREIVYASGENSSGTLFFVASNDFGDTWKTITMPDSPTGLYVNDMVSVIQNGHEVLYFGTNKGVYSYTFAK